MRLTLVDTLAHTCTHSHTLAHKHTNLHTYAHTPTLTLPTDLGVAEQEHHRLVLRAGFLANILEVLPPVVCAVVAGDLHLWPTTGRCTHTMSLRGSARTMYPKRECTRTISLQVRGGCMQAAAMVQAFFFSALAATIKARLTVQSSCRHTSLCGCGSLCTYPAGLVHCGRPGY